MGCWMAPKARRASSSAATRSAGPKSPRRPANSGPRWKASAPPPSPPRPRHLRRRPGRPRGRRPLIVAGRLRVLVQCDGVVAGGLPGGADRVAQAASPRCACHAGVAVVRAHPHHPPECGGLWLGADGRPGHCAVRPAPRAENPAGGRKLRGPGGDDVECRRRCRPGQHRGRAVRRARMAGDSLADRRPVCRGGALVGIPWC